MLIDIAMLLDIRIVQLDKHLGSDVGGSLKNGRYFNRTSDFYDLIIPGVTRDKSNEINNDTDINLALTMPTLFLEDLYDILTGLAVQTNVDSIRPDIHINTWPFNIPAEIAESIAEGIRESTGTKVAKPVHISMDELTPNIIKSNYSDVVIYDFQKWLDAHAKSLLETSLMGTSFVTAGRLSSDHADLDRTKYMEVIGSVSEGLAPIMDITHIDLSLTNFARIIVT